MSTPVVISGEEALLRLKPLQKKRQWRKLFFVVGKTSFKKSGAQKSISAMFPGSQAVYFDDFEVNPKLHDVFKGVEVSKKAGADVIIAIGGGSTIDMAKLINGFAGTSGNFEDYITGNKEINRTSWPMVAIPTTSGSGSEATHFAVVYVRKIKHSLASPLLLPEYIIHDPNLTKSLPAYITAFTGIDALCQAMESYWSVNSNDESSDYSLKAITSLIANMQNVCTAPNVANRAAVQQAAYLAGKAINITKTTAAHALSYYLTSRFGLPHGHAVALMFGWIFFQNSLVNDGTCVDSRGKKHVLQRLDTLRSLFNGKNLQSFPLEFYKFIESMNLKLSAVKFDKKTVKELLGSVNIERLGNNPVKIELDSELPFLNFYRGVIQKISN